MIGEAKALTAGAVGKPKDRRQPGSAWARVESIMEYPKPADLCLGRMKPRENGVEVRSRIDVQIIGVTWV